MWMATGTLSSKYHSAGCELQASALPGWDRARIPIPLLLCDVGTQRELPEGIPKTQRAPILFPLSSWVWGSGCLSLLGHIGGCVLEATATSPRPCPALAKKPQIARAENSSRSADGAGGRGSASLDHVSAAASLPGTAPAWAGWHPQAMVTSPVLGTR